MVEVGSYWKLREDNSITFQIQSVGMDVYVRDSKGYYWNVGMNDVIEFYQKTDENHFKKQQILGVLKQ